MSRHLVKHLTCGQTAFVTRRQLNVGDVLSVSDLVEPEMKDGEAVRCMSCGEVVGPMELDVDWGAAPTQNAPPAG